MNLIAYCRVSTDAQRDNTSLEEQEAKIQAYCKAYSHRLVKVFTEVGSGSTTQSRPIFKEAVEALDEADGLIAFKLDRIARNTRDVLTLVEDVLVPQDKALVLLDLNLDTSTPIGRYMLTSMAAVASLERDLIRERTQGGRAAKAKKGGYAYGAPPYGYRAENKKLVPIPEEQKVLRLMKNHRRSGKGTQTIAIMLNDRGHKTKRGKQWTAARVGEVLQIY